VRLMALAQRQGCAVVNLSEQATSRLLFPRVSWPQLRASAHAAEGHGLETLDLDSPAIDAALQTEAQLAYMVPSGRYWEVASDFDKQALCDLDDLWLAAMDKKTLMVA